MQRTSISRERGASMVEASILIACVAMVAILAVGSLGEKTDCRFQDISTKIETQGVGGARCPGYRPPPRGPYSG